MSSIGSKYAFRCPAARAMVPRQGFWRSKLAAAAWDQRNDDPDDEPVLGNSTSHD